MRGSVSPTSPPSNDANKKPRGLSGEYQVAGANRRWRCQFRCRGSRRESAVAQLFSLGRFAPMTESKHQMFLLRPKVIRNIGIALFVLSFLAPPQWQRGADFHLFGGAAAFIQTPVWALTGAAQGIQYGHWQPCLLGVLMVVGWFANFTVFIRSSLPIVLLFMASPWILYIGVTFLENTVGMSMVAVTFVPFYPWAFGIALIHLARLAEPKPREEPRTIWTGF